MHLFANKNNGVLVQTKIVLQLRPRNFLQHQAQKAVPKHSTMAFSRDYQQRIK
jgi:hypothetical protein